MVASLKSLALLASFVLFTTKLEGIPEEYYQYLFTTESYDTDTLANEIQNILKNEKEISEKGVKAQKFIIQQKNAKQQIKNYLQRQ